MLLRQVEKLVKICPDKTAFSGENSSLSYAQLRNEIANLVELLSGHCLGLLMDNSPCFAVADLAAWQTGITCVPLPPFFSEQQLSHSLKDAGVDMLLTDQPQRIDAISTVVYQNEINIAGKTLSFLKLRTPANARQHEGIAKITYTSGTTGQPKGVCLEKETIEQVVDSLYKASGATPQDRFLSLLPLSTLLENIGAIYVALMAGCESVLLPLEQVGLHGTTRLDPAALITALNSVQPSSMILIPQLLQALVEISESGYPLPASLRFIAIGGAPVADSLLERAAKAGLPVYQGYGLSEAASVVALNTVSASRLGSVGKPLPHISLQIADDGEIWIRGKLFSGYLGETRQQDKAYATGDLGYLDDDGYLYITGRKKNIFITAFGRNVSPEWVECELTLHPLIAQAAVFGEARPFNVAVIVPAQASDPGKIEQAIGQVNQALPDYAQIKKFILAQQPFSVANDELTGTGRLRRETIGQHYLSPIVELYVEAVPA
jgi:long-chain acyl-CoA synthetase